MLSVTIKKFIFIILFLCAWCNSIKADWLDEIASGIGGMVIDGVNESARTDVQKALLDVKNIKFSTNLRDKSFKATQSLGLSNPSVLSGLAKIQQEFKLKNNSPFITYSNINPLKMANGSLYPYYFKMLQDKRSINSKDYISDYLSTITLNFLSSIDPDGLITNNLLNEFKNNPSLATYIELNPNVLKILVKETKIVNYVDFSFLHYLTKDMSNHSQKFKEGIILDPYDLDYDIVDGSLTLSSNKGQLAKFESNSAVTIGNDIALLNCQLPPSSIISFNNSNIQTDKLGRIETIGINVIKNKYKDSNKRSIKTSKILKAKNKNKSKALFLHPKELGGVETWSNIFAIDNSKENKENLKQLNKWIKENCKSNNKKLVVKLKYNDSSNQPNTIQYYDGNSLICTFK